MDVGGAIVEPERLADERLAPSLGSLPELVKQVRRLGERRLDSAEEEMST
jgi:hypothetical protein